MSQEVIKKTGKAEHTEYPLSAGSQATKNYDWVSVAAMTRE
jgi:hypothetical protein